MTDPSSSLPQPEDDGTLELSDSRQLGYATYGPADGDPLFFFHGTPGSRYTRVPEPSVFHEHNIRQVTLERPGFGRSTYESDRTLLDWPEDVKEAADRLGFEEFAIAGESGGGPYTLACAAKIPDRLTAVGVIAGLGPLDVPDATEGMELTNRLGFTLASVPLVLRPFLWLRIRSIRRDMEGFIDAWASNAPDPDAAILQQPAVRAMLRESFPPAVTQGVQSPLTETRIHARPWGFDLTDIPVHIDLWHGGADTFVPERMARHVADNVPSASLQRYPDAGHLLSNEHYDEIFSTLSQQ